MTICNIAGVQEWFEILQTSERTQTAIMILSPDGNSSEEMNSHQNSDQVLLLLEGMLEAEVGGETRTMRQGDTCIVPAGTPHRFSNRGEIRAVTFNTYSPPEYPSNEKG